MKGKYIVLAVLIVASLGFIKYPIDGYESTGIARLYQLRKFQLDSVRYTRIPAGAYKKLADIKLNLTNRNNDSIQDLLVPDRDFERKLNQIIPNREEFFFKNAGHLPQMESPKEFNTILFENILDFSD